MECSILALTIYALNAITDAKLWSYHDAPSDVGTAIVANGMVYVLGFTRLLVFGL